MRAPARWLLACLLLSGCDEPGERSRFPELACEDIPCDCDGNRIGRRCHAGEACECSCAPGFADCSSGVLGCETDLRNDPAHCGDCYSRCDQTEDGPASTCSAGICTCPDGFVHCSEGCVPEDASNCGACLHACSPGDCFDGVCKCPAGLTECGSPGGSYCADTQNDPSHCGDSCHPCSDGLTNCVYDCIEGSCVEAGSNCPGGTKLCGDCPSAYCLHVDADPLNCGDCDVVCPSGGPETQPVCTAGQCGLVCDSGRADCDGDLLGSGCEVDIVHDVAHCGGCNQACVTANGSAPTCVSGSCKLTCDPGYASCTGPAANDGCETATSADSANCGGCGLACPGAALGNTQCVASVCVCTPGRGDCNGDFAADGCETALVADPFHCGVCAHSCQGGSCANGQCQPFLLAFGQAAPVALAVDGTYVYWANGGSGAADGVIQRAAKLLGGAPSALATGRVSPADLVLDGGDVLWVEQGHPGQSDGALLRVPVAGGAPVVLAGALPLPLALATDGVTVYVTAKEGNALLSVPRAGGAASTLASLSGPREVVLDGAFGYVTCADGSLSRVPLAGGAPTVLAAALGDPWGVAVDGTSVYVRDAAAGKLVAIPKAGGAAVTLASGLDSSRSVVLDGASLVYGSGGALFTLPVAGGAAVPLAQAAPTAVAPDVSAWFWVDGGQGVVVGLAR